MHLLGCDLALELAILLEETISHILCLWELLDAFKCVERLHLQFLADFLQGVVNFESENYVRYKTFQIGKNVRYKKIPRNLAFFLIEN